MFGTLTLFVLDQVISFSCLKKSRLPREKLGKKRTWGNKKKKESQYHIPLNKKYHYPYILRECSGLPILKLALVPS